MLNSNSSGTPKRRRGETRKLILDYIIEFTIENGYPPSVREICTGVGLKSTSTVHAHLKRLEESGELRRNSMQPRAIEILNNKSDIDNNNSSFKSVPLLGSVAAGLPILAEENQLDQLEIPDFMLGKGEHFALKVSGESMISIGIMDGDTIVVRRQTTANNGDIVVALIDDEATVKRFYKENGHFRLQPENPDMAPIYTPTVEILGKVVSVFRVL
ncbi:MAG: transcriptional repressor LexA [Eubacteriales bacterium]|nr:transcriptional repressor LexA [Eubacteriales bacterium]